jgi:iron complex outermembrane recepter protein
MSMPTFQKKPLLLALAAAMSQGAYSEGEEFVLEEVIVTAERRSESIQDIPASISAITGDTVENLGIRDVNDLQNFVPGLTVKSQSIATTKFNIRGVGQAVDDITVESGVGVFIDDIYLPRMGAAGGALFDLEGVEVLRGPQGTLYGRNTAGGSINFITKKPSDDFEGKLSAEVGNYDTRNLKAYVSGPLVADKLFGKISFISQDSDGYMTNQFTGNEGNGSHTRAGRVGLRYLATDDVEILFTADAESSKPDPTMMNIGPADGYQSFVHELVNNLAGEQVFPGEAATKFYETNVDNDGKEGLDTWGLMLRSNVSHSDFDASYILGYRESDVTLDADRDMSTMSLLNEANVEASEWGSLEARFTSNTEGALSLDGDLEWTLGFYYFMEDGKKDVNLYNTDLAEIATRGGAAGYTALQFFQQIETEAYAIFGQTTYSLTDSTRVTTGLRWTQEEKTVGIATNVIDPLGGALFGPPNNGGIIGEIYDIQTSEQWDDITIKLGLEHDLSEDTLLYVQYSEGFKSGGFNGTSSTSELAQTAFDPEDVESFEMGVKSNISNRLKVNLSLFKMDYKNLQTGIVSNGGTPFILNANADIQGGELEVVWIPVDNLTLSLAAGFIDSEYTEFEGSPEREGTQVNGVPELKYSLAADYFVPLSVGEIILHADYGWEDETTTISAVGRPSPQLEDWDVINLRVSFEPNSGQWELSSWVRNAADEEYWLSNGSATASTSPVDSMARLAAAPRTYGLAFTYFLE